MKPIIVLAMLFLVLSSSLALPPETQAAVVGQITQMEGRVDLLKGGKLPATQVKVGDPVESGDVLRSKSLSKAQITFIDNSLVTISPESRLAIEDYQIEPAQGKRHAVLELFQGLAHVVVSQIFKVKEPDFLIKTHTAITGVRGTDFGVRLYPNSSTILNFKGKTQVGNIFPEVTASLIRAQKIAFGGGGGGVFPPGSFVLLGEMQSTTVQRNLPPTLPVPISPEDQMMFMQQMSGGLLGKPNAGGNSGAGGGAGGSDPGPMSAIGSGQSSTVPASSTLGVVAGTNTTLAILNTVTVPPTVTPPTASQTTPQAATQTTPTITVAGVAIPIFNILATWGSGARDLDLHLTGPSAGGTFHVYYASKGSLATQPYALLNADNLGTNGSEVITVKQFNQGGLYQAYVYNYGNSSITSTNLSTTAGLSLSVINGGTVVPLGGGSTVTGGTLVTSLTPTAGQVGNTWIAVTIDPATGQVTTTNQITNTSGGTLGASALTTTATTAAVPATTTALTTTPVTTALTALPTTAVSATSPAATTSATALTTPAITSAAPTAITAAAPRATALAVPTAVSAIAPTTVPSATAPIARAAATTAPVATASPVAPTPTGTTTAQTR